MKNETKPGDRALRKKKKKKKKASKEQIWKHKKLQQTWKEREAARETERDKILGGIKVGNNKMKFYWNYYCCKQETQWLISFLIVFLQYKIY